jgi:hypothetical protein
LTHVIYADLARPILAGLASRARGITGTVSTIDAFLAVVLHQTALALARPGYGVRFAALLLALPLASPFAVLVSLLAPLATTVALDFVLKTR